MTTNKTKQPARRNGTINLRVGDVQKETIDRAAAIQSKSRTEFIRKTSINAGRGIWSRQIPIFCNGED